MDNMMKYLPFIAPLDSLMMLISNSSVFNLLGPLVNASLPMPVISAKPDFAFEFDAVPTMLSGFKFSHPLMPFHPIHHPEGVDPPVESIAPCDASERLPEADFLKILWSSIASLALPPLMRQGNGNFPNHHLCCYFRSLTGSGPGSCGKNPTTNQSYVCSPPSWR